METLAQRCVRLAAETYPGHFKINREDTAFNDESYINLATGEILPIEIPPDLLGVVQAYSDPFEWRYQSPQGITRLRKRIIELHFPDLPLESCLITSGAKEAFWIAYSLLIKPGDRVLVPKPGWLPYIHMAESMGAVVDTYDSAVFFPDVEKFAHLCSQHEYRVVVINSPSNPQGATLDGASYRYLATLAQKSKFMLLSDEVYRLLQPEELEGLLSSIQDSSNSLLDNLVVVDSLSKLSGFAGVRIGSLLGSDSFIKKALLLRASMASLVSIPSQQIALSLLDSAEGRRWISLLKSTLHSNRGLLSDLLSRNGLAPNNNSQKGLYLWLEESSSPLIEIRKDLKLQGKYGTDFGSPFGLRLSLGAFKEFSRLAF